jgi:hypothetical protein
MYLGCNMYSSFCVDSQIADLYIFVQNEIRVIILSVFQTKKKEIFFEPESVNLEV